MWILIKNNIRLLLRDRVNLTLLCLLPFFMMGILGVAFPYITGEALKVGNFEIGYSASNAPQWFANFKEEAQALNIQCIDLTKEKGIERVNEGKSAGFIGFQGEDYTLYRSHQMTFNQLIIEELLEQYKGSAIEEGDYSQKVATIKLQKSLIPSSKDYYGIVETVLAIWLSMYLPICLENKERKNAIYKRINPKNLGTLELLGARWLSTLVCTLLEVGFIILVEACFFQIQWGQRWPLSMGLLFLGILAANSLGTLLSVLIRTSLISYVVVYISTWFYGFLGGNCQSYMVKLLPEKVMSYSPLYFMNRTLVELSYKGSSRYFGKTLFIFISLAIVSCFISFIAMNDQLNREGA